MHVPSIAGVLWEGPIVGSQLLAHCAGGSSYCGGVQVAPGLCVAGMAVAQDREILRRAGVTHVVNCVGMLPPATPFAGELQYLVLHLLGGCPCLRTTSMASTTLVRQAPEQDLLGANMK